MALVNYDPDEGWGVEEVVGAFANPRNWEMIAEAAPNLLERGMAVASGNYPAAIQGSWKYAKGLYNALRVRADEETDIYEAQDRYMNSRAKAAERKAKQGPSIGPRSRKGYGKANRRRGRMRYQYYGYKPPKRPYYHRYL